MAPRTSPPFRADHVGSLLGQALGVPPDTIDLTYPSTPS